MLNDVCLNLISNISYDFPGEQLLIETLDKVICGESLEILQGLPTSSVDLVFADPPYNLQLSRDLFRPDRSKVDAVDADWDKFDSFEKYDEFSFLWLSACKRILKDTGTLWVIGSYHNIYRLGNIIQNLGYWILNDVVWIKDNPMPNFRGVRFTNAHETLIWAQKRRGAKYTFNHHSLKALNDDRQMRSDWHFPLCKGSERIVKNGHKVHATQKPETLLYRILMGTTRPGDIILDPFFGTGTTGVVAKKLGRHFIGIEREPEYVEIARERIQNINEITISSHPELEKRDNPRIPFGALLENGMLRPGERLFFQKDPSVSALICSNGHLRCGELTGSIHSLAKELATKGPVNGWDVWLFEENGIKKPIDLLRTRLRLHKTGMIENEASKEN